MKPFWLDLATLPGRLLGKFNMYWTDLKPVSHGWLLRQVHIRCHTTLIRYLAVLAKCIVKLASLLQLSSSCQIVMCTCFSGRQAACKSTLILTLKHPWPSLDDEIENYQQNSLYLYRIPISVYLVLSWNCFFRHVVSKELVHHAPFLLASE